MWALLAVVAQRDLQRGAMGYGILNGCIGLGAVTGAFLLPRLRAWMSPDAIAAPDFARPGFRRDPAGDGLAPDCGCR